MESRRSFLYSLSAAGVCAGYRAWGASPASCVERKPNLTFGVVSDIHISTVGANEPMSGRKNNLTFRHALEWFRAQGVDAVVVAGDLTNKGSVEELRAVAEAWYRVFPGDRAPDGRSVTRVFVTGNHDFHGYLYGKWGEKVYPDPVERARHLLRADLPRHWKDVWGEPYERSFHKRIGGYDFFGRQWDDGSAWDAGADKSVDAYGIGLDEQLKAAGIRTNARRPFFYIQHPHPKDTCYGAWAWGHDTGRVTQVLSRYPQAIALSGHSHYSLTDERSLWQGAFTSFGCGSLRYSESPYDSVAPLGYENSISGDPKAHVYDALKMMPVYESGACRQGSLWRVYDDGIVVSRREFLSDASLGKDWDIPLPTSTHKSFVFANRKRKASAPQFAKDAELEISKIQASTRETKGRPAREKAAVVLLIPPALACRGARPLTYEVTAIGAEKKSTSFQVLAEGYDLPLTHPRARQPTRFVVDCDRLPASTTDFSVRPVDCWGLAGRAVAASGASLNFNLRRRKEITITTSSRHG